MPNAPKTPLTAFRIDPELWRAFGEVAEPDRSAVLRDFIRWFSRQPGAKMPKRPDLEVRTTDADQDPAPPR